MHGNGYIFEGGRVVLDGYVGSIIYVLPFIRLGCFGNIFEMGVSSEIRGNVNGFCGFVSKTYCCQVNKKKKI